MLSFLVATVLSLYEKIIYRIYVFSMWPAACNCFTTYCPATTLINHGKRPMTNEILGRIFVIANGLHAYRCQLSAKHALPFVAGLIRSYRAFYIVTENEKHRYKHNVTLSQTFNVRITFNYSFSRISNINKCNQ